MRKYYLQFFGSAFAVLFLDQLTKWLSLDFIEPFQGISVIPGFFNLVLVFNRGIAFGILNRSDPGLSCLLLSAMTLLVIATIIIFFLKMKDAQKWPVFSLSLIVGGASGNLADRLHHGYVIDFLDFYIKSYHWPAFNVADSAVTIGTILFLISISKGENT